MDEVVRKMFDADLTTWSASIVRDFLQQEKLTKMIPLCTDINGVELVNLYEMCKSNTVTMYYSLKSELSNMHHQVLPIATYLQFVNRIRVISGDTMSFHVCIPNESIEYDSINTD